MKTADIFLQCWGGMLYLIAKILLAKAEGTTHNSKWRTYGWVAYLAGIPAWVIVLANNQNWIAMTIEAGGVPSIILGLMKHNSKKIEKAVDMFVFLLIAMGIICSIRDHSGINTLSQVLELGITAGFLIGTLLLAKKNPTGWIWFMLMNISMGTLMSLQEKWIFVFLQAVSLCFVIYGFIRSKRVPLVSIDILITCQYEGREYILLGLLKKIEGPKNKQLYGVPGRNIKFGETISNSVKRNIREECGCNILNYKVICVNANYKLGNHYIGIGVVVEVDGKIENLKPEDWKTWEWFTEDRIPKNLFQPARNLIECYFDEKFIVSE